MEVARDSQPLPQSEPASEEANAAEAREEQQEEETEVLISKAQALMDMIVATHENPNPNALHALAAIFETEESRIIQTVKDSTSLLHESDLPENDVFFDLISSKFLTDSRYSVSVQAAAVRLLFCCSITWTLPHVFEDDVLENIRGWVINEISRSSADDRNWNQEIGRRNTLVAKRLSEFIRDSGSQTPGGEQNRWQAKLAQVTVRLIRVVITNSSCAITSVARATATPPVRRIERGVIAAATPIYSPSRELLLFIHERLRASGLTETAATLLKETQLTPLPSLDASSALSHQGFGQEASPLEIQWPSGRTTCGFLSDKPNVCSLPEDSSLRCDSAVFSSRKKPLESSGALGHSEVLRELEDSMVSSTIKNNISFQKSFIASDNPGITSVSDMKSVADVDVQTKIPIMLPMKRKLTDLLDNDLVSSGKRLNTGVQILSSPSFTPPNISSRRSGLEPCACLFCTPLLALKDYHSRLSPNVLSAVDESKYTGSQVGQISSSQHRLLNGPQPCGSKQASLDSRVVQYLKHQHVQFPDPITLATLPPLSLIHTRARPEPRRSPDAPSSVTARLTTREFKSMYGGIHGSRKDRQFVYSRFRRERTCRDETSSLQTCISFLGDSSRIATGGHYGELKVFGSNSNSMLGSCRSHLFSVTLLQSRLVGVNQLVLSSTAKDVRLWDASSISGGPKHSFEGIKAARFSNSGSIFAAVRSDPTHQEVHLYDVQTCQSDIMLSDTSSSTFRGRGHEYSLVHFSPSDTMLLWNGVLWDRRGSDPIHRFDQFDDYGGGAFTLLGTRSL